MKKEWFIVLLGCLAGMAAMAQEQFQLAPPFMKYPSVFFEKETSVSLLFAQKGTSIHYTTNGKVPTQQDPEYRSPIRITEHNTTVRARVFGKGYQASEVVEATFIKGGLRIASIRGSVPFAQYAGEGEQSLYDNKGGNAAYTSKTWMGWKDDRVSLTVRLSQPETVGAVLLDLLQDQGSWIFFPARAEVYALDYATESEQKVGQMEWLPVEGKDLSVCKPFLLSFDRPIKTDMIRLELFVLQQIPDWHPGKGQRSWIFLDEIKLY